MTANLWQAAPTVQAICVGGRKMSLCVQECDDWCTLVLHRVRLPVHLANNQRHNAMIPRSIFADKYTTWSNITDDNYDEIVGTAAERTLQIRVADHSLRCGNLDKGMADVVLSFVTAEDNATAGRFGFDYLLEWSIAGMSEEQASAFIESKVREHFGPVMSQQLRNGEYANFLD
jgi:hypothetical protein